MIVLNIASGTLGRLWSKINKNESREQLDRILVQTLLLAGRQWAAVHTRCGDVMQGLCISTREDEEQSRRG